MHSRGAKITRSGTKFSGKGVPGDRPPILPWAAIPAYVIWFLLMGSAGAEISALLPYVTRAAPFSYKIQELIVISVIVLPIMIGMRYGKLWSIRLFRYCYFLAIAMYFPILIAAFYLRASKGVLQVDPYAPYLGNIIFVFSALELVGFFVVFRALKRVRWLDPNSLPHEWEPPANSRR